MIYGTGSNARGLAEALEDDAECHVVGFLDSDPSLEGRRVSRLRVFAIRDLEAIFYGWNCHEVILTVADSSDDHDQEIVNRLIAGQIPFRCLPSITRPIQHRDHGESYNDLDEEALLGRRIIRSKVDLISKDIKNRCVFVSGAGGSIGGEICKQVVLQMPKKLVIFDSSESALYRINLQLTELFDQLEPANGCELVCVLGNVLDYQRLADIFRTHKPETVYHAAAYKHVPIVESNWVEGIRNNTIGTYLLGKTALENKVSKLVLISTDKAVRPTSVMGASKRAAEMIIEEFAQTSEKQNLR